MWRAEKLAGTERVKPVVLEVLASMTHTFSHKRQQITALVDEAERAEAEAAHAALTAEAEHLAPWGGWDEDEDAHESFSLGLRRGGTRT